jgi:hypothetical protein
MIMKRVLFGSALIVSVGTIALNQNSPTLAAIPTEATTVSYLIAQEPNQDNLQMTCTGSILVNDVDFTVFFTREAGFSRIQLRRRSTGQQIAETFLSYDRNNSKGQAIWRGNVNDAADVTLVHLSSSPAQVGDQVSVGYDGQWGRGTCR